MLLAVIRRGARLLLDRHNHFGFDRVDHELAVLNNKLDVLEVLIGVLEVASNNAYRIFASVRSLGRPRFGRRFLHTGVYVIQLIVSRHALVARNAVLLAVIRRGARLLLDRHNHFVRDRRDRQRSRIRRRNFIFIRRVNRANRTFRKRDRIFFSVLSRSARCGNIVKGDVFLRADVARFNRLIFSIIRHRGVLRRQRHVLIIVEIKNVIFFIRRNGDRFRRCTLEGVAAYILLYLFSFSFSFRGNYCIEVCFSMERLSNLGACASPIIIHRVAQVFLLLEYSVIYSIRVQT